MESLEDRLLLASTPFIQILDDGDAGFSAPSGFFSFPGQGYQNDVNYAAAGTGGNTATWNFTGLTPGLYRVSATWSAHPNRATNAPFTVLSGGAFLGLSGINQELSPDDFSDAGAFWEDLGGPYAITGTTLTVRLSDNANDYVIADAVRIERIDNLNVQIVDDGDPGFSAPNGFFSFPGQGYQNDVNYAAAGTGGNTATWTFAVTPGAYRVAATWSAHPNRATNAPFTILNGSTPLATVLVNQELAPNDFSDAGVMWEDLGTYTVTGNTLAVRLSDNANDYVIADAIRVIPLTGTRFAVIGDYGVAGQAELDVSNLVRSWNPDFILTTGDNNYNTGSATTIDANIGQYYHDFIAPYTGSYGAGATFNRFFPSLGNHDWDNPGGPTPYFNYFTLPGNERYYEFAWGPIRFFAIDSDGREPDGITSTSTQGAWLQGRLAAATEPWRVVYFHHPPYTSSSRGPNIPLQWPFQQWGATAVLTGHEHQYERIVLNNFPYLVNGLGGNPGINSFSTPIAGSQVRYNANFGAMLVDVNASRITFQFVTRAGTIIDAYTIALPAGPLPTVSVTATDASASEVGGNTAAFTVTRTGSTSAPLNVIYTVTGTATNGVDYATLSGVVTIPAGASSAPITVTPIDDTLVEGNETVTITLAPNTFYTLGTPGSATATIADNEVNLVPTGSTWRYLDNGSNQGTAWRSVTFNDSSWAAGPAQLGYGDGDEATVVSFGPNANNKYITTYFRHSFTVANPAVFSSLLVRLLRDDGAVVYLNGTEVVRSNLPAGTISFTTLASSAVGGADESTYFPFTISPSLLVSGTNVLAVEIHQASVTSSDISFDLQLIGSTIS